MELEINDTRKNAIIVRKARKSFGGNVVLDGLNMTVERGIIYGLLGASGCGKTSLLECLIGLKKLNSGRIILSAKRTCEIGYMPQVLSLHKEFTIMETMIYFGTIHGMKKSSIRKKARELIDLFSLPCESCLLRHISGGEQRRVSLAVAILHDPPLLLLDEPTVGVDPLLSVNIWKYFKELSSSYDKTILITTHYIEETKHAHMLGFIRNGRMLVENTPSELLAGKESSSLENIFLSLIQLQSESLKDETITDCKIEDENNEGEVGVKLNNDSNCNWRRVLSQLFKNYCWMRRNLHIFFFLLVFPIVQTMLFCTCIGSKPTNLDLAFVNEELPNSLKMCPTYLPRNVTPHALCHDHSLPLSCAYINAIQNRNYNLREYSSEEKADCSLRRSKVWATFHFHSNFTRALSTRLKNFILYDDVASILHFSDIDVRLDTSNQYISSVIMQDLMLGYTDFIRDIYRKCPWSPEVNLPPFQTFEAMNNKNLELDGNFTNFFASGLLVIHCFIFAVIFTMGALLIDKVEGVSERSVVAGVTFAEVTICQLLQQSALLVVQIISMMCLSFVVFKLPYEGALCWAFALLFVTGLCGSSYGFFVSTICDSESAGISLTMGTFFLLSLTTGMLWPVEGMHVILKSLKWAMPVTSATEAFRGILFRKWTLSHPLISQTFFSLFLAIAFFAILTVYFKVCKKGNSKCCSK